MEKKKVREKGPQCFSLLVRTATTTRTATTSRMMNIDDGVDVKREREMDVVLDCVCKCA